MPKVLLVEDDNNLREIFEMRLKAEGYQTVTAGNGEEALAVAMKERPDLIIADVMMPKLSGFEMLETLRTAPEMAATKTIMMTALGQPEDRARGERLGVLKYLVKSQVTLEDFVRVVGEVLSPTQTADGSGSVAADEASANSALQTNQESEQSMQEDSTNQGSAMPQPDSGAGGMPNPMGDSAGSTDGQQSAAQEQSAMQDKINNFVDNGGTGDAAAAAGQSGGSDATGSGPTMPSGGDMGGSSGAGMSGGSGADMGGQQPDVSTPPAPEPTQPPADTGAQGSS
jgi:CheY-like chemotaxis protein